MKMNVRFLTGILTIGMLLAPPGWVSAATKDFSQNVTVNVGNVLSITFEDDPNLVLEFTNDFSQNAISFTGKTIVYTVRANNMPNSALLGAVSARISTALNGIAIVGDPGAYINDGTSSSATLVESAADFITIGTTATNMFDKPASSGTDGKLLAGRAPIHYRARALRNLTPADGGPTTLIVTLKDA